MVRIYTFMLVVVVGIVDAFQVLQEIGVEAAYQLLRTCRVGMSWRKMER